MNTVSIIIPVYNVEDYIEPCLQSVVEQTYPHLEVICINDATRDNSVSLVHRFQRRDARISLVQHRVNRGLGAARNTGLHHATGRYIKFVDGDDALVPDSVEALVAALDRTDADWAFGDFHVIDEHGRSSTRSPFHVADLEARARSGPLDIAADPAALNGMWPSAWMGLWRIDRIRTTAARFPEGLHFEDHEFFFTHGFQSRTAAYLGQPLYQYRGNRPGQITRDLSNRMFDIFTVLERLFPIFARHLQGDALRDFSARTAVRLIAERTWIMPADGDRINAYRSKAAAFLARFPRETLFSNKDWYISDDALALLLDGAPTAGLDPVVASCEATP